MKREIDVKVLVLAFFCLDKILIQNEAERVVLTLLKIITAGLFGVWWFADLFMILIGKYRANPLEYFGNYVKKD